MDAFTTAGCSLTIGPTNTITIQLVRIPEIIAQLPKLDDCILVGLLYGWTGGRCLGLEESWGALADNCDPSGSTLLGVSWTRY